MDDVLGRVTEGDWLIKVPRRDIFGLNVHPSRQPGKINQVQSHSTRANLPWQAKWQATEAQKQKSP